MVDDSELDFVIREQRDYAVAIAHDQHEHEENSGFLPARVAVHQESPAQDVPLHWHSGIEVIYPRNRTLEVHVDGHEHVVKPGECLIMSPCALHTVHPRPAETNQDVLSFGYDEVRLSRIWPDVGRCLVSWDAPGATEESRRQLVGLCEQIHAVATDEGPIRPGPEGFHMASLLLEALYLIVTDFRYGMVEQMDAVDALVRRRMTLALAYVRDNYAEDLSTQSVADHVGYSREYFCRLFKDYSGTTFKAYLTDLRLAEAASRLVREPQVTCAQVRADCGFADGKGFVAAFQRRFGMSPTDYRLAHRTDRSA